LSAPAATLPRKPATYADLEAVPPHLVAEIVHGVLETHPRPSPRHSSAASLLGYQLIGPFEYGRGGPSGWHFLDEPELHLGRNVVVPDIGGWRRERLPVLPEKAFITIAPDWICEVLSPATARLDRGSKRAIYAAAGVSYLWLFDPVYRVIEAFQLVADQWSLVGVVTGSDAIRLPPFDAISFPFDDLFTFDPPSSDAPVPQG
jgi:Uma2 family endonuclease